MDNSLELSFRGQETERKAHRRYQLPTPEPRGRFWTIRVRTDDLKDGRPVRVKKRIRLALLERTPVRTALKLRDEYMSPINNSLSGVGSATPFREFVHGTYLRFEAAHLSNSTTDRYTRVLKNYLVPEFGKLPLRDLTPARLQFYFSKFADSELSVATVDKIRDVLSAVLRVAHVKYGFIDQHPMEYIKIPRTRKRTLRERTYITPEEFDELVSALSEPYATMVHTAIYTGLRVSELVGLKWNDIGTDSIRIDERYCRGDWSEPKTQASTATIGADRPVIERLRKLKDLTISVKAGSGTRRYKLVKKDGLRDLVFQSVKNGAPMSASNILARHIKPAARALGIGFVNWRCLRTSCATWMIDAGANPKDVQGQMRHAKVATTLGIYAQVVPDSVRRAIERTRAMAEARIAKARTAKNTRH